ncbi:hypothetical protein H113_07484 [Trichophyton rubrum MR1459]|nr:hypothetical protein H113_07484 [Trichophyton rubrum MR1459]
MTKTHMQKMEIRKCTIMTLTMDMSSLNILRVRNVITQMDERTTTMTFNMPLSLPPRSHLLLYFVLTHSGTQTWEPFHTH